jgi:hypothetical protein
MTLRKPFWDLQTASEIRAVRELLGRRFPLSYSSIARCLELADPFGIVYPGNPGEYDAVVWEMLVLLAPSGGSLDGLSVHHVFELLTESLARCFGETAPAERVRHTAELLTSAST